MRRRWRAHPLPSTSDSMDHGPEAPRPTEDLRHVGAGKNGRGRVGTRWPIVDAHANVPGPYAVYGTHSARADLELAATNVATPMHIGKAEDSFVSRDLRTHFASARTGQSTVRWLFAALLRRSLIFTECHVIPRSQINSRTSGSPVDDAQTDDLDVEQPVAGGLAD